MVTCKKILQTGEWMRPNYSKSDGNYRDIESRVLGFLIHVQPKTPMITHESVQKDNLVSSSNAIVVCNIYVVVTL